MKNKLIIIICIFMPLFFGCSSQLLETRTNSVIERSHIEADTVYLRSNAGDFVDLNIVWYHKGDSIHNFWIVPDKTISDKPVEAKNIAVDSDSTKKNPFKGIQCFDPALDRECIVLCIKGRDRMFSGIDTKCFYTTTYEPNSFPYKLQYDLSKLKIPRDLFSRRFSRSSKVNFRKSMRFFRQIERD